MTALRRSLLEGVEVLQHTNARLDVAAAERASDALLRCSGRRFFTGVGKSGLAASRMASSLTSIGLAAQWVHGSEWSHGELGAVGDGDLITAVSHSGRTKEMVWLAERLAERHGARVELLALTGNLKSPLAQRAAISLECAVPETAELLGLLPTGSQLAQHHVFNALLCECAGGLELSMEDVERHHPRGAVGAAAAAAAAAARRAAVASTG
jgi:D-arabinose 5-phosphate isomerase GutQ